MLTSLIALLAVRLVLVCYGGDSVYSMGDRVWGEFSSSKRRNALRPGVGKVHYILPRQKTKMFGMRIRLVKERSCCVTISLCQFSPDDHLANIGTTHPVVTRGCVQEVRTVATITTALIRLQIITTIIMP